MGGLNAKAKARVVPGRKSLGADKLDMLRYIRALESWKVNDFCVGCRCYRPIFSLRDSKTHGQVALARVR
jgi:hypothetical protein